MLTWEQSIILEKDIEVTKDPRGVYLTGDAIRILYSLGLGHEAVNIGQGKLALGQKKYQGDRWGTDSC